MIKPRRAVGLAIEASIRRITYCGGHVIIEKVKASDPMERELPI